MSAKEGQWPKVILSLNSNIEQAIQVLNDVGLRIVLIIDSSGILLGSISDGDIRRGLLRGLDLSSPIESVIQYNPLVVAPEMDKASVIELMIREKIQQVPIVDKNLQIIGLHHWDEINTTNGRSNLMVIMAGGKGTRLHPQTENCPKPMLMLAGKPILEHIINRAKKEGFSNFVISIHHLGHIIEEYFGDGLKLGVNIEYLREEFPLGTAGALSLIQPVPGLSFVVTNGDVISDIRYGELLNFHEQHKPMATMAIRSHEWQNPFGVVQIEGIEITGYVEKPVSRSYINAGVYVIEPAALEFLSKSTPCDMPELFSQIQEKAGRVIAYPLHEQWLDIGRPEDFQEAIEKNGFRL